ncbi:MAG TPA: hypothetical protein VGJ21_14320 [Terracidiphilus sp.]
MYESPDQQWRELTAHYAAMWDEELLNLAADYKDLTEMAQQVLRDEMRKRGLGDPTSMPKPSAQIALNTPRTNYDLLAGPLANSYLVSSEDALLPESETQPHDYTWKTLLCECDEPLQAYQLSEALRRAGIESWAESMPGYAIGGGSPRVLVPADRLDEARVIAAQPIPQDIIDQSKEEIPEFVMPQCPKCGAVEPTLVSVEPSNIWQCESCGKEWTDPLPVSTQS